LLYSITGKADTIFFTGERLGLRVKKPESPVPGFHLHNTFTPLKKSTIDGIENQAQNRQRRLEGLEELIDKRQEYVIFHSQDH